MRVAPRCPHSFCPAENLPRCAQPHLARRGNGLTEREARQLGFDVAVASKPVAQIAATLRMRIEGDARGSVKVVVDRKTDRVLGAALMHLRSQETINLVALAMRHGITATDLRDAIYTHPSVTEALNEVLGSLDHSWRGRRSCRASRGDRASGG